MTNSTKLIIMCGTVALLLVSGGYIWYQRQERPDTDVSYPAIKKHLETVMLLPPDDPMIVEVTDAETLKKQDPFYKMAKQRDLVIIWKNKAAIYRPSIQKLVDWGVIIDL